MKKDKKKKRETAARSKTVKREKVVNYDDDPFFIEKAKKAEEFIKKHGLPPDF